MPKKKLSKQPTLHKEYTAYRKKLERQQRKLMEKGYIVGVLPKEPKKITEASLRKIHRYTTKRIKEEAVFYEEETNVLMSYQKHQKKLKEQRKLIPAEPEEPVGEDVEYPDFYDMVVENFRTTLAGYLGFKDTKDNANKMLVWLDGLVSRYGTEQVAQMITKASDEGVQFTYEVLAYNGSGKVQKFMYDMLNYLEEAGQMESDTIDEIMQMQEQSEGESYST